MENTKRHFFSIFIATIVILFILLTTYNNASHSTNFEKNIINSSFYIIEDTQKNETKKDDISSDNLYLDQINYSNSLFFSGLDEDSLYEIGDEYIFINKGIFIADFYNSNFNYQIRHKDFVISQKSPGKFLVDSRAYPNIKIFSFDSLLTLSFLFEENKEIYNTLELYPHMSIYFNATRNRLLKNVDVMRLNDLTVINYIAEPFLRNTGLNNDFYNRLYPNPDDTSKSFLQEYALFVLEQNKNSNNTNFLLKSNFLFNGLNYIRKYFFLFLNESKKAVYYKNLVINDINNIIKDKKLNSSLKNSIKSNIDLLKKYPKDYNELIDVLKYYYVNLYNNNSIENIEIVLFLGEIIEGENNSFSDTYFYLTKLYDQYTKNILKGAEFQNYFSNFLRDLLADEKISFSDEKIVYSQEHINFSIEDLAFYLKNIIVNNINFEDIYSVRTSLYISNLYYSLNEIYINDDKNPITDRNKRRESLGIIYSQIFDKILYEMKKTFFTDEKDDRGLLVLSKNNFLQRDDTISINGLITKIFTFFNQNRTTLQERNRTYLNTYLRNKSQYDEYYLALTNYEEYRVRYDELKDTLLTTTTISEMKKDDTLSRDKFLEYISGFNGINYSNAKIDINNNFYTVKDIVINGNYNIGFDLYPFDFYFIDNIYINDELINASYELESIGLDWKEKYDSARPEDRHIYDFKNFFINTFDNSGQLDVGTKVEFNFEEDIVEEDQAVVVFKRDRLLGNRGEFKGIIDAKLLDLKYENIDVVIEGDKYDIYIKDTSFNNRVILSGNQEQAIGIFNSSYVFSQIDHYFKGINLKLYNSSSYSRGDKVFMFGGNNISVEKNIEILNFENDFKLVLEQILASSRLYNEISNYLGIYDFNIKYLNNGKILYTFRHKGLPVNIYISNGNVVDMTYRGRNVISNGNVSYRDIIEYLAEL